MFDTTITQDNPTRQILCLFRGAVFHSRLRQIWAKLTHRCFCLQDLDETLQTARVQASHYAGIRTVCIERIQGTQGKVGEFDAEFNPIQERTRARWVAIALEKLRGRDLPPVELVQIDDVYYVRDGHHRISVSRALGQSFIEAEVTIMQLQHRQLVR